MVTVLPDKKVKFVSPASSSVICSPVGSTTSREQSPLSSLLVSPTSSSTTEEEDELNRDREIIMNRTKQHKTYSMADGNNNGDDYLSPSVESNFVTATTGFTVSGSSDSGRVNSGGDGKPTSTTGNQPKADTTTTTNKKYHNFQQYDKVSLKQQSTNYNLTRQQRTPAEFSGANRSFRASQFYTGTSRTSLFDGQPFPDTDFGAVNEDYLYPESGNFGRRFFQSSNNNYRNNGGSVLLQSTNTTAYANESDYQAKEGMLLPLDNYLENLVDLRQFEEFFKNTDQVKSPNCNKFSPPPKPEINNNNSFENSKLANPLNFDKPDLINQNVPPLMMTNSNKKSDCNNFSPVSNRQRMVNQIAPPSITNVESSNSPATNSVNNCIYPSPSHQVSQSHLDLSISLPSSTNHQHHTTSLSQPKNTENIVQLDTSSQQQPPPTSSCS